MDLTQKVSDSISVEAEGSRCCVFPGDSALSIRLRVFSAIRPLVSSRQTSEMESISVITTTGANIEQVSSMNSKDIDIAVEEESCMVEPRA